MTEAATQFLNVDLEIVSGDELTLLVEALSPHMHVLFNGRVRRTFRATLELGGRAALASSPVAQDPDRIIRRMIRLVAKLPRPRRAEWDRARERRFDLGFECGGTRLPPVELKPGTLRAVAEVGGSIVVTLYPATPRIPSPRRRPTKSRR